MAKKTETKTYKLVGPNVETWPESNAHTIWGLFDEDGEGYVVSHLMCLPLPDEEFQKLGPGASNGPECLAFKAKQHAAGSVGMSDVADFAEVAANHEEDADKALAEIIEELGIEVARNE